MDLGCDGLEHERYAVASNDGEEVFSDSVSSAFVANFKAQLGLIERKRIGQVVDNKKGSHTVQHCRSTMDWNIACVEELRQALDRSADQSNAVLDPTSG